MCERLCYCVRWGLKVTRHPFTVILSCLVITGISSLGYLNFRSAAEESLLA